MLVFDFSRGLLTIRKYRLYYETERFTALKFKVPHYVLWIPSCIQLLHEKQLKTDWNESQDTIKHSANNANTMTTMFQAVWIGREI